MIDDNNINNDNIYEVERKFLLKNIPYGIKDLCIKKMNIIQYYLPSKSGQAIRIRKVDIFEKELIIKTRYFKTIKNRENEYANSEIEIKLSFDEFDELKKDAISVIEKIRYVLVDDSNKWEIDYFFTIRMVMAEVEILTNHDDLYDNINKIKNITLPKFITNELIMEVTDMRAFSNKRLSMPIPHYSES